MKKMDQDFKSDFTDGDLNAILVAYLGINVELSIKQSGAIPSLSFHYWLPLIGFLPERG